MAEGYFVYRGRFQSGDCYTKDKFIGRALVVFPNARAVVSFGLYDFAIPHDQVQLVNKIREFGELEEGFGEKDIGLEKLTEMSPEEWTNYMKEVGWSDEEYACKPFEVDDELVELLGLKVESKKYDKNINEGLKSIIFSI